MILVESALIATEESALLDPIAPLQDDDVSKELLDETPVTPDSLEVSAGTVPAELDSSTGAELLLSSPQATSPMAMQASAPEKKKRFILISIYIFSGLATRPLATGQNFSIIEPVERPSDD